MNENNNSGQYLSLEQIKEIIELISAKGFNEFELERGDFRLRLQLSPDQIVHVQSHEPAYRSEAAYAPAVHSAGAVQQVAGVTPASVPVAEPEEEKLHIVTSPIVGTFYKAPSPDAQSFAKVGDHIESGQTICIVEAMKLMNEIQSDASGIITKIFVENAQPVEYGQALFGIKI